MQRNVILIVNADLETESAVLTAAGLRRLETRCARTRCDGFAVIQTELEDVLLIIIDLDAAADKIAELESLEAWTAESPVIVVASDEEFELRPIALAHGAREYLQKPLDPMHLNGAIEERLINTIDSDRCDLSDDSFANCDRESRHDWRGFAPSNLTKPKPCTT